MDAVLDINDHSIKVGSTVAYSVSGYGHGHSLLTGIVQEIVTPDTTKEYNGVPYRTSGTIRIKPDQAGRKVVDKTGKTVALAYAAH